ncbi:hypothetical protein CE195_02255 [Sodalis-like symbiont of Philaenus spumarius]|nr:hypothetical protein CE195_02810 [Sodalis-like symbiont of Philaenus spumarius]OZI15343.1 hypothetical protein CE195_02255 [Sodalis-like symbiont of Philaenus spumarius]
MNTFQFMLLRSFTPPNACLQRFWETHFHRATKKHAKGAGMHKNILLFIAAALVSVNTVAADNNTLKNWQKDAITYRIQESH